MNPYITQDKKPAQTDYQYQLQRMAHRLEWRTALERRQFKKDLFWLAYQYRIITSYKPFQEERLALKATSDTLQDELVQDLYDKFTFSWFKRMSLDELKEQHQKDQTRRHH